MEEQKNEKNIELKKIFNQSYKYGFQTIIEREEFPKGLNKSIIQTISQKKEEPSFLKHFRLDAFQKWQKLSFPFWSTLQIEYIDFNYLR